MNYINFHSHSQYSNIATPDVVITNKDRIKRAVELGHIVASGVEHGWGGNFFEFVDLCKEYNIKPLLGTEAYFVKDRLEKDRTNAHLILLAKNENGRKAINRIISEANVTGFYYKARVDLTLLDTLPESDVWVTTACLGGIWKYDDAEELLVWMHEKFKNNFYIEVQYHHTLKQKVVNKRILELSEKYRIPLIAGMDSHMISNKGKEKRDIFLASRGIIYEDEYGWFLDFPSRQTAIERFRNQGILTEGQIEEALDNTNIFEQVQEYDSPIFDKEKIKLPTIYPDLNQDEKNQIFSDLINAKWNEEKLRIPLERLSEYEAAVAFELDTVLETGIADYFLLNYEIIKEAKKNGGRLTLTSRGSAPGFYLSKLLEFTTVDRLSAKVKLYPERFISKERILETKSLPDIDFNVGNPKVFEEAQTKIMGQDHAYRMITYQKSGASNAWKLYARFVQIPFDEANIVSAQIKEYDKAIKYAETDDDKEKIKIHDFVEHEYLDEYEKSKAFLGTIQSLGSHPCAFLLLDIGKLDEEIGLIRTRGGEICVAVDGKTADKRLFLKNDLLKVTVVDAIYRTYDKIGIEPHTVDELLKLCEGDDKVWSMYSKGATQGLNQVETVATSKKVSAYAPKNISELSSFVAAIRPGFKSNYAQYSRREDFSYGVPAVDNLIQTDEFPFSYMLYQENAMSILGYAGIPMYETYQVVKNIAKKNHDAIYEYENIFKPLLEKKLIETEGASKEDAKKIAEMIWKIIEDSAEYSFNASHSYSVANDSLYGAWQKAHHHLAFYEVLLKIYEEDSKKDKILLAKAEAESHFGVSFPSFKWGQDNRTIVANDKDNSITMSLSTIKGFGTKISESFFELNKGFKGETFLDLLIFAEESKLLPKSKWRKMIQVNYFSPFGIGSKKLEKFFDEFTSGKFRYSAKHTEKTKEKRLPELSRILDEMLDERYSIKESINNEIEILGSVNTRFKKLDPSFMVVTEIDHSNPQYAPKVYVYSLSNGTNPMVKIYRKQWKKKLLEVGDIVFGNKFETKNKQMFKGMNEKGKPEFEPIEGVFEYWMLDYRFPLRPLEDFVGLNRKNNMPEILSKLNVRKTLTQWK